MIPFNVQHIDHLVFRVADLFGEEKTLGQKIFLAGAAGAIGKVLTPLQVDAGFIVYGTTRQPQRLDTLKSLGAVPVLLDVFDADALNKIFMHIQPWAVVHQLTDLPQGLDPSQMAQAAVKNARIRDEGTRNLVSAAAAAGCNRIVAQSIAWAYQPGKKPYAEDHPLDLAAEGSRRTSVYGVIALENAILNAQPMIGTVLRYGQLFGPGTGNLDASGTSPVHVEAAAFAALLALQKSEGGIFNITQDNPDVCNEKAKQELGWIPEMRRLVTM